MAAGRLFDDVASVLNEISRLGSLPGAPRTPAGHSVSNEELLELYGLFKQAKEGDCRAAQPGVFQVVKRAKWNSWDKRRGSDREQAKIEYVKVAEEILRRLSQKYLEQIGLSEAFKEKISLIVQSDQDVDQEIRSSSEECSAVSEVQVNTQDDPIEKLHFLQARNLESKIFFTPQQFFS